MTERKKMSMEDRAKQFAPFAALRGFEEALEKKRRELGLSGDSEKSEKEEMGAGPEDADYREEDYEDF